VDFSFAEVIKHFTAVTWTIALTLMIMSVLSVGVWANRALYFNRTKRQSRRFAEAVAAALSKANVDGIFKEASSEEFKASYLARIVRDGLSDAQDLKSKGQDLTDLSTVDSAMDRAVTEESELMRKWMTILATVSSTAPFVGLLGTVFGIINSFKGMESEQGAGLSAVAGGIAEALVMTGFGLIVAIPAVWLYNWANARVDGFVHEMSNSASEMLDWIKKNRAAI
jgi:biopolymer transport protein ExbB/TolQ